MHASNLSRWVSPSQIDDWWLIIDYSHIIYFQRCSSSYASSWRLIIDYWLLIGDDWWLIIHSLYIFSGVHQATQVSDDWLLIVFTRKMRRTRIPQAEGGRERESSEFKRNLNGGPQADEVRIQVSINDDWWLIVDCLHTENAEDTEDD